MNYQKIIKVINENYYYFTTIYNQQHILSFYNILNIVNLKYNLYI